MYVLRDHVRLLTILINLFNFFFFFSTRPFGDYSYYFVIIIFFNRFPGNNVNVESSARDIINIVVLHRHRRTLKAKAIASAAAAAVR